MKCVFCYCLDGVDTETDMVFDGTSLCDSHINNVVLSKARILKREDQYVWWTACEGLSSALTLAQQVRGEEGQ